MKLLNRLCLINKTLIIRFDIEKVTSVFNIPTVNGYYFKECISGEESNDIAEFYRKNNYSTYITREAVEAELRNSRYFAILDSKNIVAGMWIHEGTVNISAPSFEALKTNHNHVVKFARDVVYSSHNLVDLSYRGKGIYSMLLLSALSAIRNSDKKYYLIITGYDNKRMIDSSYKYMGQIVGAVTTIRLFKYIWIRLPRIPIIGGVLGEYSIVNQLYCFLSSLPLLPYVKVEGRELYVV